MRTSAILTGVLAASALAAPQISVKGGGSANGVGGSAGISLGNNGLACPAESCLQVLLHEVFPFFPDFCKQWKFGADLNALGFGQALSAFGEVEIGQACDCAGQSATSTGVAVPTTKGSAPSTPSSSAPSSSSSSSKTGGDEPKTTPVGPPAQAGTSTSQSSAESMTTSAPADSTSTASESTTAQAMTTSESSASASATSSDAATTVAPQTSVRKCKAPTSTVSTAAQSSASASSSSDSASTDSASASASPSGSASASETSSSAAGTTDASVTSSASASSSAETTTAAMTTPTGVEGSSTATPTKVGPTGAVSSPSKSTSASSAPTGSSCPAPKIPGGGFSMTGELSGNAGMFLGQSGSGSSSCGAKVFGAGSAAGFTGLASFGGSIGRRTSLGDLNISGKLASLFSGSSQNFLQLTGAVQGAMQSVCTKTSLCKGRKYKMTVSAACDMDVANLLFQIGGVTGIQSDKKTVTGGKMAGQMSFEFTWTGDSLLEVPLCLLAELTTQFQSLGLSNFNIEALS